MQYCEWFDQNVLLILNNQMLYKFAILDFELSVWIEVWYLFYVFILL